MPQIDEDTKKLIQEMQILEANFEQLLQQKHMFNMELNETVVALKEIEKADGDLFKIVGGQIIIKKSKEVLNAELSKKRDLIELRIKNIESQEKEFANKLESLKEEVMKKISPREN
jgi:prefoldin beta subunit